MMKRPLIAFSGWLLPLAAWGGSSQNYTVEHSSIDNGSSLAASESYVADISSTHGGAAGSTSYANRVGCAGQLADVLAVRVVASAAALTMVERGTRQFAARLTYDDASQAVPAAERLTWSVPSSSSAVLAIGLTGLATAGSVYQDSGAGVRAVYQAFSDTLSLVVLNSGTDDFGTYAADGLADLWQVRYVGEANPLAGPNPDADGDGLSNLQEFAFGTDPATSSAGPVRWSGSTFLSGGVAVPFASGTGANFTFRAVFARRRDFASAGLSYTVEFSGDLASWKASTATPVVLAQDSEIQVVSVPYPFFVNGRKANWFRVRVQSN
jgi:hypothetical protein